MSTYRYRIALTLSVALTLTVGSSALGQTNIGEHPAHVLEDLQVVIVDSGWSTPTSSSDCTTGEADDTWQLQLTDPKRLTVTVEDCCCPGDYFEVFVNGIQIGTTPNLAPPWGCDFSGPNSSGSFTVPLCPGDHLITVRDAGFDGHSPSQISDQNMCPAGFTVSGGLAPLSLEINATSALTMNSPARAIPRPDLSRRDTRRAKVIEAKVVELTPFIETDHQGYQHLRVSDALRAGVSPSTLGFGHRLVSLNNRIVKAAHRDKEASLSDRDFEFIEPYYIELALQQEADPCTDRDNPAVCPERIDSGFCFATREEVEIHLESSGFHRTANYAGGRTGNDYTRVVAYPGCSSTDAFREQAIIEEVDGVWTFNSQGPEPNPEILSYLLDWPYFSWGGYVRWWHMRFC